MGKAAEDRAARAAGVAGVAAEKGAARVAGMQEGAVISAAPWTAVGTGSQLQGPM